MKTIKEHWDSFLKEVIPEDAPEVQISEMRRAFYGGAASMIHINLKITQLLDDDAFSVLDACADEIKNFKP